tara:strand:+ start:2522 stop:3613 length:1092 start_codon:yes stop_codon:yes gene_type:complete
MANKHDYYESLGIPRDASDDDVRRAFRKKAMEFHPDRNKDPSAGEHFREVNEAYQVLSDKSTRRQYDQFGHAGVSGNSSGSRNAEDFSDIFGGFGDIFDAFFGGDSFGTASQTRVRPGNDLEAHLIIDFASAAFGISKEIEIQTVDTCKTCLGSRCESGTSPTRCSNCEGTGRIRKAQRSIFGQFVQESACKQCYGTGELVTTPCKNCRGLGKERLGKLIQVEVPPGVEDGVRLQIRGQGDIGDFGGGRGNLYVSIGVQPHPFFKRRGDDLLYDLFINFPQAALGVELEVPTLDGAELLKVPAGTQAGAQFRLKNLGIPHLGRPAKRGDAIITVNVLTPEKLSKEQRELLQQFQKTLKDDKKN